MSDLEKTILTKKLLYRSRNRGCKETDLLLGRFAENTLPNMTTEELGLFATILEQNDADIYDWATGKTKPPKALHSVVMNKLLNFKPA